MESLIDKLEAKLAHIVGALAYESISELARLKNVPLAEGDATVIAKALFRIFTPAELDAFIEPLVEGAASCPVTLEINRWLDRRAILHLIQAFERVGDRAPLETGAALDLIEQVMAALDMDRPGRPILVWPGTDVWEQMAASHLGAPIVNLNAFGAWIACISGRV